MSDHILTRRARFWLAVHDVAGVPLHAILRFRLWTLSRATSTVRVDRG
jgi:hypothetical protein